MNVTMQMDLVTMGPLVTTSQERTTVPVLQDGRERIVYMVTAIRVHTVLNRHLTFLSLNGAPHLPRLVHRQ